MKKFTFSLLFLSISSTFAQSTPSLDSNSEYFSIKDSYYFEPGKKDLSVYNTSGFFQRASTGNFQKIFLLPSITVKEFKFISNNGKGYLESEIFDEKNIEKIQLSLNYNGSLPTKPQTLAILKSITHTQSEFPTDSIELLDLSKPNNFVVANLNLETQNKINTLNTSIQNTIRGNNALINTWNNYNPNIVAMTDVTISLLVDGENFGETKIEHTFVSNGTLPNIYINNVTPYVIKRIKDNGYQIMVSYSFRDTNLASIHAKVDFSRILNKMIEESRKTSVVTSSSGFQFLGFGKRKQTMRESIKEQLAEQLTDETVTNTSININDADDQLITYFESIFFPKIEEKDVITRHLDAADEAGKEGKKDLEKAHRKYAQYLSTQNPDLKVDTEKAIASLAAGDYVGFIAQGFKVGSVQGGDSTDYVRVLNFKSEEVISKNINLNKTVSVNRSISQVIEKETRERDKFSGICGSAIVPVTDTSLSAYIGPSGNPFFTQQLKLALVNCIIPNSPSHQAGIVPGDLIYKINGKKLNIGDDVKNLLNESESASIVFATPFIQNSNYGSFISYRFSTKNIQLGKGIYK